MLPRHLVAAFWDEVGEALRTREGFSGPDADAAVAGFWELSDRRGPPEMIYHREPEDAAKVVAGWWLYDADRKADVPA
jgi:hypothetical protein